MRKIIITLLLMIISSAAIAQNGDGFGFGAKAGVNISDITHYTGKSRAGLSIGGFADYNFSRFGIEGGLYYNQYGSNSIVTPGVLGNHVSLCLDYFTIELLAKYQIFNGFRIFLGPQFNTLLSARIKYSDHTLSSYSSYEPFDIAMLCGVGYTFSFGLDLSASFNRGFIAIADGENPSYNTGFTVSVGWRF